MIFVVCGIPGSGKTTLAHKLAEQYNAIVHSYDAMADANTKKSMDGSVKQAWLQAIHDDLKVGRNVVCDGMNLTVEERKEVLSATANIPCRKVLVVKVVPLETCLQRNAFRAARLPYFVLEQAARRIEPPTPEECWDEILISKD